MNNGLCKAIIKKVDRYLGVFIGTVILAQALFFIPPFLNPETESAASLLNGHLLAAICIIITLPFFYSLLRATIIYDDELKVKYLNTKPLEHDHKGNAFFIARLLLFWIEILGFAFLFLIIPIKWEFAAIADLFPKSEESFLIKLLILLVLLPVISGLSFFAHMSAMNYWYANEHGLIKRNRSNKKTLLNEETQLAAKIAVTYGVIGFGATIVVPFTYTNLPFLASLFSLKFIFVIIGIILLLWLFRYGRALIKRRIFIKRLKSICKKEKYEIVDFDRPYRSVFAMYDGESFCIRTNDVIYSCKLISVPRRSDMLLLQPEEICHFSKTTKLFGIPLSQRVKSYQFGWDSGYKKILIINPVSRYVCDMQQHEFDNGDIVGKYKIFTGTAFLNALDRKALDR